MKISFKNELGRDILVQISINTSSTPAFVTLKIIGPDSESEWIITEREAHAVYKALDTIF